jgi:hypothetical protein
MSMSTYTDHEYGAVVAAHSARRTGALAAGSRKVLALYGEAHLGLDFDPEHARRKVVEHAARLADAREAEVTALRRLNSSLLALGVRPGESREVDGHLYRAANPGGMATHLGAAIPADLAV